jgi:tetratricopeptide (TPR) repeat protein
VIEKIPLFILSGIIAYATFAVQLDRAIASVGLHSILDRICFAGFGVVWYLLKVVVPYPLSALHPFPESLSIWYYLATVVSIAGVAFLVLKVKNRNYLFGFGFYLVNLLLVLQLVSIGNAVVAERYTYVPYIGIFFLVTMEIYKFIETKWAGYKRIILAIGGVWIVLMMVMTWMRIPVWKSSETLWEDILHHYPDSPRAWTNKGLIYYDQKDWNQVIEHLSNALKYDPLYADALEWRARSYLETKEYDKALADALAYQKVRPTKTVALFLLARIYDTSGNTNEALNMYNKLIPLEPNMPEYINNRGTLYFNKLQNYEAAKKDFEQSIQLNPSIGLYYLNLSRCYYMLGDAGKAKEYAQHAKQLGSVIDPSYAQMIGLE